MKKINETQLRKYARVLASRAGKASVKIRFNGMSREERSEYMRKVRAGKKVNT